MDAYLVKDHVGRMVKTKKTHDKGETHRRKTRKESKLGLNKT